MESPKLYNELAEWWPLMSAPADYAEEAAERWKRHLFIAGPAVSASVGFEPEARMYNHSEVERPIEMFLARRP
jgi:hypothetical protein